MLNALYLMNQYPDRIPVVILTNLKLEKSKFLVPKNLRLSEFMIVLKKKIKSDYQDTLFVMANNKILNTTWSLNEIYNEHKRSDNYLYLQVEKEATFG